MDEEEYKKERDQYKYLFEQYKVLCDEQAKTIRDFSEIVKNMKDTLEENGFTYG